MAPRVGRIAARNKDHRCSVSGISFAQPESHVAEKSTSEASTSRSMTAVVSVVDLAFSYA